MKKIHPLLQHVIAVAAFLLATVIFCKPATDSDLILKQGDVTGWQGMSNQSYEYKKVHGQVPLWVTSMFGGMPAFQVAIEGTYIPIHLVDRALQLWLPKPMHFFFLACISFYIFCLCLRIRLLPAIIGAIGFAFASFSPIIVTAGHDTQMTALAYCPAVIGGVVLLMEKKYFTGFALSTLFIALQVIQGHQQITYYLYLILAAMCIAYAIRFIKQKEMGHVFKAGGLLILASVLGIAVSSITLLPVYDFAKYSKRGGQLVMDPSTSKDKIKDGKTVGLTRDYAFMWSYGKTETLSLMFPGVMGYGTHIGEMEGETYVFPKIDEKSHVGKFLTDKLNVPEDQAANIALQQSTALYWGDQPFTNGPVYLGAVMCFFFILGMFLLDGKHKWWMLTISIIGILLALGKNLPGFNYFMFDYFPFYNKFRVPTMTLVIPQIIFPMVAAMTIHLLMDEKKSISWKKMQWALITTGLVFVMALGVYASADFSKEDRERTRQFNQIIAQGGNDMEQKMMELNQQSRPLTDNQIYEGLYMNFSGQPDAQKTARSFVTALQKDRAALFMSDILRSFLFVLIAAILTVLIIRNKISAAIMAGGVLLLTLIDQLGFGMKYMNKYSFEPKDKYEENAFPLTEADKQILRDPDPNFRVFNTAGLDESKTSYYHKSIGGYHPAKLGIYDDLMAYQLSGRPNMAVLNMLNAKYFIQQDGNGARAFQNPDALGNVWFVQSVQWANGPVEEMKALTGLDPKQTAVIDATFKNQVPDFKPADSASSIRMSKFDNDEIQYQSEAAAPHLAVFSEVYYKDWKAYINGKPAPYVKANYVLRAMVVPAGKNEITFRFEPNIYHLGNTISTITGWLVFLLFLVWVALEININRKQKKLSGIKA
ncbi:MAG: YfhO family protein [Ferruginibacter sp.]|nr:YfhO family protein [Ferruginibacter sp.]